MSPFPTAHTKCVPPLGRDMCATSLERTPPGPPTAPCAVFVSIDRVWGVGSDLARGATRWTLRGAGRLSVSRVTEVRLLPALSLIGSTDHTSLSHTKIFFFMIISTSRQNIPRASAPTRQTPLPWAGVWYVGVSARVFVRTAPGGCPAAAQPTTYFFFEKDCTEWYMTLSSKPTTV